VSDRGAVGRVGAALRSNARQLRDAKITQIYYSTNQIQRVVMATALLV
jgi:alkylation response protein AidB-like acyl-CoA dehydrogenase